MISKMNVNIDHAPNELFSLLAKLIKFTAFCKSSSAETKNSPGELALGTQSGPWVRVCITAWLSIQVRKYGTWKPSRAMSRVGYTFKGNNRI